jgi:hypothetical protein
MSGGDGVWCICFCLTVEALFCFGCGCCVWRDLQLKKRLNLLKLHQTYMFRDLLITRTSCLGSCLRGRKE